MRVLPALLVVFCVAIQAQPLPPIADIHTHYKWSQVEVTSPQQAITALEQQNVELAVVIGSPAELALQLENLDPQRIVPVYGPYNDARNWYTWYLDPGLVDEARQALASGRYQGIGEMHLIGGFSPRGGRNPVIEQLMELGAEFRKPLILHSEFSRATPFLELCRRHPRTPVLWAHAGAVLAPDQVREVLDQCPAVYVELAARDPWRFVNSPIADGDTGRLLPEWEKLVLEYAERFLVGSDTVWPVDGLGGWEQADTGWQELGRFLGFHRRWLSFLPPREAELIGRLNAYRVFGLEPPPRQR